MSEVALPDVVFLLKRKKETANFANLKSILSLIIIKENTFVRWVKLRRCWIHHNCHSAFFLQYFVIILIAATRH